MSPALVLICVVVVAYLAAPLAFEWLARRFLIVSGAEYLVLGVLLGPHVSGLIGPDAQGGFAPFLTFALGWVGLVVGAQFYLPELVRIPRELYRVAFTEAALSLVLVTGATGVVLWWWFGLSPLVAALPATALGAIAVATAPLGINLVTRDLPRRHALARQLQVTSAIDALVAVLALAVLLSIYHPPVPWLARSPTPTEWAVIGVAIGGIGGALFHLFLGEEHQIDRLFIGLAGAVTLASGAAAYLRISPLLPTMLIGMILANTSRARPELRQVLGSLERPVYYVMLIFAGTVWELGPRAWVLPVLAFLVIRIAGKTAAAWLAAVANGRVETLGAGWGRALLGHGGLAVALALIYHLQEERVLSHVVFTATMVSVLLTDLASARLAAAVVGTGQGRRVPGRAAPAAEEA